MTRGGWHSARMPSNYSALHFVRQTLVSVTTCFRIVVIAAASFIPSSALAGVQLTWDDNSNDETGFRIERADSSNVFSAIGTVGSNVTLYYDAAAQTGTLYHYRVAAFNAAGS